MEIENIIKYKLFAYNVIRMEEDEEEEEEFWMHCARFVKALSLFFQENDMKKLTISEICKFLHKHAMKDGGSYSKNGRIVGNHIGIDPMYISKYMEILNQWYGKKNIPQDDLYVQIYFNFLSIHPFSDGNGRVAKALLFILKDEEYVGITQKKDHKKLCVILGKLQRKFDCMFNIELDVSELKKILK